MKLQVLRKIGSYCENILNSDPQNTVAGTILRMLLEDNQDLLQNKEIKEATKVAIKVHGASVTHFASKFKLSRQRIYQAINWEPARPGEGIDICLDILDELGYTVVGSPLHLIKLPDETISASKK